MTRTAHHSLGSLVLAALAAWPLAGCGLLPKSDVKVIRMLKSQDAEEAQEAVLLIARQRRLRFVSIISQMAAKDERAIIRATCVKALAMLGRKEAIPLITKALKDGKPMVRWEAAEALGDLQARSAIGSLVAAAQGDLDAHVRAAAARSLGRLGGDPATEGLIGCLRDRDTNVAYAAAEALHTLTKQPFDLRYRHWQEYWDRRTARRTNPAAQ